MCVSTKHKHAGTFLVAVKVKVFEKHQVLAHFVLCPEDEPLHQATHAKITAALRDYKTTLAAQ